MTERAQMAAAIGALLDGTLAGAEAVNFLATQDIAKLTPAALAGAVDAVIARAVPFPAFPDAVDGCGTGGDGHATYNISTAAAIVVAARGITVAKHGNRAVTSQSGSADVLEALGVRTNLTPVHAARMLEKIGIAFLFAPTFHPGFARVAPLRKAVGHRTIFNLLGPLCNPARIKRQLIGVFAAEHCRLMAETAALLGHTHLMAVHGEDGTDELSITGTTHASTLAHGTITYAAIRPQDAGLTPHPLSALIGGDAATNANALRAVMEGATGAYADAVALNAAALLVIAEKATNLHEGVMLARGTIARGDAARKLDELIEESHADG